MTIKTLEFIHKLLKDEDCRASANYRAARDLQHEYEDHDADKELIRQQTEAADELMLLRNQASNALLDFESQEW